MKGLNVRDHLEAEVTESSNNYGDTFVKLEIGDNIVRILPGVSYEIRMHFNTNPRFVCPRTDDQPCKLCDTRQLLYKRYNGRDNMPDNVRNFYDSLKVSVNYYYPVIHYTNTEMTVKYLRTSKKLDGLIRQFAMSMGVDQFDEFGLKLNLKKTKAAGKNAFPSITPIPTSNSTTPIEISDWQDKLPNLEDIFKIPDDIELTEYITTSMAEFNIDL